MYMYGEYYVMYLSIPSLRNVLIDCGRMMTNLFFVVLNMRAYGSDMGDFGA